MPLNIDTGEILELTTIVLDTDLPKGSLFPAIDNGGLTSAIFTISEGDVIQLTAYNLQENENANNTIVLTKVKLSSGTLMQSFGSCGTKKAGKKATVIAEVNLVKYKLTPTNPVIQFAIPGTYRLNILEGVENIDDIIVDIEIFRGLKASPVLFLGGC